MASASSEAQREPEPGQRLAARRAKDPTVIAFLCCQDEVALRARKGITKGGRRVHEDFSVVGRDDHPLKRIGRPPRRPLFAVLPGVRCRGFGLLSTTMQGGTQLAFSSKLGEVYASGRAWRRREGASELKEGSHAVVSAPGPAPVRLWI
ncbi:hypothetical protein GSU40_16505 [Rathayibacter sp. VKM Ac-2805]|nr:hypothetical protein GSU40_16505 [Rathayibacter sp. VKM Ac-2805]